jgi:hypothetical protein
LGAALAGDGWGSNGTGTTRPGGYSNGANGAGGGGAGTTGGRNLPAWSDLTGAGNQADPMGPGATEDPLPQRRPVWGADAEAEAPPIPRQPTADDPGAGRFPPAPAVTNLPPPGMGGTPAAARPPVWPPVGETDPGVPALPESLSASLDMTSELPRFGSDVPAPPSRYADDLTMELPIFQELESAWFTPEVASAATADPWAQGGSSMASPAPGASARPSRTGETDGVAGASSGVSWRSAADDGWLAAQAALEPQDGGETERGLPKRVPMAQLVPGGVETSTGGSDRRTPDSVRGLLSAYTRGVQRGRGAHANAEPETDSQTSGKEQEA